MRLESPFGFLDTVARLRSALEAKAFTIMAMIDHRLTAEAVGLAMPPTLVLIYGNPKGGTLLMLAAPDFALELPLRVLVREGADGRTYVVFNSARSLEGKHGLPGMTHRLTPAESLIRTATVGREEAASKRSAPRPVAASRTLAPAMPAFSRRARRGRSAGGAA